MRFRREETEQSIGRRFEAQVENYPARLAVKAGARELTYRALNEAANRVGHAIVAAGGSPTAPVALLLEDDILLTAAMLGASKAARPYVVVDPSYPPERMGFMLEDSQTELVLSDSTHLDAAAGCGVARSCALELDRLSADLPTTNLGVEVSPDAVAYLLYTSGSTGTPKGVVQNHRVVLHNVMKYTNAFHVCADDRFTMLFSYSFGEAMNNIYSALLNGAAVLPWAISREGLAGLAAWLRDDRITIYHSVCTVFRHFIAGLQGHEAFPALRVVNLSGEAVYKQDWELYRAHFPASCVLVNSLGSTETKLMCQFFANHDTQLSSDILPVGYAAEDVTVQVLDDEGREAGPGRVGEIVVTGKYLSQGYWRRQELTADAFRPSADRPGGTTYRTGDLARVGQDGALELLGRGDSMVKVRGLRIELGEVEAVLAQHPAVQQAAAVAREDEPGQKRLVAYVVPAPGASVTVEELRRFLAGKLPEPMAPSAFVLLDALPLTPNGKVDRRALPAPSQTRPELAADFVAPRTPAEEAIARTWQEVLRLDQVGAHDNFFDLGGHSLLAMQVLSRVSAAFKVPLPLRSLFDSPTVAALASRVENALRDAKALDLPPVDAAPRTEQVPLSFAQQRLWFLSEYEPGNPAYNVPIALRLRGPLDVAALAQGLNEIVRRHEALRTAIGRAEGQPVQVIAGELHVGVPAEDLRGLPAETREARLAALLASEARQPFDLARGPLLRCSLFRLADQDHVLLLTMHHIVTDGWSVGVLFGELGALYEAFAAGRASPLPPPALQYADYAVWQRSWLQGEALETQLAYWRRQLAGLPVLELPSDRARLPVRTHGGSQLSLELPRPLVDALRAVGRQQGATLFMALLAAFKALLWRYTGQADVAVGSPVAGRSRPELERLIGFFVNTLVLRTDLSGDPSFCTLLTRVRETTLAAYEHQDIPFDRLVAELQPGRSSSYTPLVQVMFGLQESPEALLELPGLAASSVPVHTGTAKFDLTAELLESASGVTVELEHSTDLLDAETVARMAEHYRALLEGIVANPQARIGELPLLTADERQRAIVEWNDTASDYLAAPSVSQLFELWAARTPDAVAAVAGPDRLTYRELNERANQLAHRLRRLGVGRDVLVGVCVERSLEMAVAFLGVLKAGGAYVPLDPRYPAARLACMLEDARAPVVLAQERLRESLPDHGAEVLCLDTGWHALAEEGREDSQPLAGPDDLAYVIYTSGSTGQPKGVAVPHRAILRLVVNTDYLALQPSDVVAQASNISFDAATFEIWGPLLNGARFVVIPTDVLLSPRDLAAELARHGVTALFVTTALFNRIADEFPLAFERLRCLLFGGEASDPGSVAKVLREGPPQRLLHVYGPTEATTFATWHHVTHVPQGATTIPIGRPIANTTVLLLDQHLNPVPVGVPGELHIGGPGLARGYLNSPDLTAARFIRDPFGPDPDERLYKTGDLARYLPDGSIEFLGRLDNQVKLRGFRIEPGEIEAVLRRHPSVADAAVIAREDTPGDKRLVAYLVASSQPGPPDEAVRAFLANLLPDYMIPSAFVPLDRLPLTPNGKVDRAALPAPTAAVHKAPSRPPRNLVEQQLAEIWQQVLGVPRIGVDESFFDVGGHSLLAVRLFADIARVFGRKLPIGTLFQAPTIEQLAVVLGELGWAEGPLPVVTLGAGGAGRPLFCVSALDAFAFLPLARHLGPDRPIYVLHPLGGMDHSNPRIDIAALAERHVRDMRAIQPEGPYLLCGHSVGGVVAFEMAQRLHQQGERLDLLAMVDTWCPSRGLLRRVNRLARGRLVRHFRALCRLRLREKLGYLTGRMRARKERKARPLGHDPALEDHPDKEFWGPLNAAYARALRRYVPRPYAGGIVLCLCAREADELFDPRLMWRKLAAGGLELHSIPGDHQTIMQEPNVRVLAEALRTHLATPTGFEPVFQA